SGSRPHYAAPRRAATTPAWPRGLRPSHLRLRRPSKGNDARAVSGGPKAPSEPAAPPRETPREPDMQGRGDDKAPSEPAAPPRETPREPDTQGRGDDGSNS